MSHRARGAEVLRGLLTVITGILPFPPLTPAGVERQAGDDKPSFPKLWINVPVGFNFHSFTL